MWIKTFLCIQDDCFEDMEEPLYGFVVEVTVSENQTCEISPTSENNSMPQCQLLGEDSFGENDFPSGMPADH